MNGLGRLETIERILRLLLGTYLRVVLDTDADSGEKLSSERDSRYLLRISALELKI